MIIWRSATLRGNNNSNNKGGTYYANNDGRHQGDQAPA